MIINNVTSAVTKGTTSTIPVGHEWTEAVWDWPLQQNDGVVKVTNTKDKFEVGLDVAFFTPNEIEVSYLDAHGTYVVKVCGAELLVFCRHESRSDQHGSVKREIHRAYKLPADVDATTLKSHLSSRGVLTITAAKKH